MKAIKKDICERVIKESKFIIKTKKTIRETAKKFGVSKSTVHKDIQDRIYYIDKNLYEKVKKIMKDHINVRHIRGGESTKQKYINYNNR